MSTYASTFIFLLFAAQTAMTPQSDRPDPEFLDAISASIRGIFAVEVEKYQPPFVETEFRKIVRQPELAANDAIMANLMFVVRKKDIVSLRPGVIDALHQLPLKPHAELSALKTLYALGGEQDRATVDDRFARRLLSDMKASDGVPDGPFLNSADRIGGPKTLAILKSLLPEATSRQREAESKTPRDYNRVAALDSVRSSIASQILTLTRKFTVLATPEPRRTMDLLQMYRTTHALLGFWAYRELVGHPSEGRIDAVRRAVAGLDPVPIEVLLLLRDLKAPLSPEEVKALQKPLFIPPDWEAALDR